MRHFHREGTKHTKWCGNSCSREVRARSAKGITAEAQRRREIAERLSAPWRLCGWLAFGATNFIIAGADFVVKWLFEAERCTKALIAALSCLAILTSSSAFALDVHTVNLAKGQQVWYVSDRSLPVIAMSAAIPAGSAYDPTGKPGLAAFAAALLDQGAGRLNADAFQTALANRAIRLSVSCSRDWLIVSLLTLTDNAKDAFHLLGQALSQPRFDADSVARTKEQILSRMTEDGARPDRVAADAFYGAFFHDHPYAHPISGNRAAVSAITAGDLKHFASAHWSGSGVRIAVSGDIDGPGLTVLLKSAFGRLALRNPPAIPTAMHEGGAGVRDVPVPGPKSVAAFGLPGVLSADRDYTAAYVANFILAGSLSSILAGRDRSSFDSEVSMQLITDRKAGFVLGEMTSQPSVMRKAITLLRGTLRDYAQDGLAQAQLDDAKAALTGAFPLAFDSDVATATHLNEYQRAGLGIDYVRKRNALISAVTLDQVKRAAKRLFNPSRLTVTIAEGQPPSRQSSAIDPQNR